MVVGGKQKHARQKPKNPKILQKIEDQRNKTAKKFEENDQKNSLSLEQFQAKSSAEEILNINPFINSGPLILSEDPTTNLFETSHLKTSIDFEKLNRLHEIEVGSSVRFLNRLSRNDQKMHRNNNNNNKRGHRTESKTQSKYPETIHLDPKLIKIFENQAEDLHQILDKIEDFELDDPELGFNTISINEILSCYRTNNQQVYQQDQRLDLKSDDSEEKSLDKDEVDELEDWLDDVL